MPRNSLNFGISKAMFYLANKTLSSRSLTPIDWPLRFVTLHEQACDNDLRAFYSAGVVDGATPIADVPLLAIDFETTGFNPQTDGIVSIGAVSMTLSRIHCATARHWVVKPRVDLNDSSIMIHGITHTAVHAAPDLSYFIKELLHLMAGHIVVIHYRGIERPFLDAALRSRLGEGIEFPVIDTMELESRVCRAKPLSLWDRLRGQKPTSVRLADSRSRYHLPYYRPHHALTDALATAELLQAQIAHHYTPETPVQELWL